MKIDKFRNSDFGEITTITSEHTGVVMFIGSQIGRMWGHTNMKQVVGRLLLKSEYHIEKKSDNKELFDLLINNGTLPVKAQRILLINTDGLIKLTLNTDKLIEKQNFIDWLKSIGIINYDFLFLKQRQEIEFASILIPFIKYHGYNVLTQYKIDNYRLDFFIDELNICIEFDELDHKYKSILDKERDNFLSSKNINTIRINQKMNYGEALAFISFKIKQKPELACAMSFTDSLVEKGFDLKTVSELSLRSAVPLFQGMIELGITPKELLK